MRLYLRYSPSALGVAAERQQSCYSLQRSLLKAVCGGEVAVYSLSRQWSYSALSTHSECVPPSSGIGWSVADAQTNLSRLRPNERPPDGEFKDSACFACAFI